MPNFILTSAGSLLIQCDASDNNDDVYIDAVTIVRLNGLELIESGVSIQEVQKPSAGLGQDTQSDVFNKLVLYPNPTNGILIVELPSPAGLDMSLQIVSITGQRLLSKKAESGNAIQSIEVSGLPQGMYLFQAVSDGRVLSVNKFVKQ